MADNLSALELVPRGVEGTGKAVVLGNEPVVQSLARLSSRMDNLQRLKMYSDAKKAQAKQKEVEYDKTPINVSQIEGGVLGGWNTSKIQQGYTDLTQKWLNLNPEEKQQKLGEQALSANASNTYVKNVNATLPKVQEDVYKLGYNTGTRDIVDAEKEYLATMDVGAKQYAQQNNITDPQQIQQLRDKLVINNSFTDFYANRIKNNPNSIDLNRFGQRIYDVLGQTSRQVVMPDGQGIAISRDNLYTEKGNLDTEKLKLAINADSEDSKMFNLATTQYLKSAANATGDKNASDAVDALLASNYNVNALDATQKKLIEAKVMPAAQNAVLQRMFAGKGKFETTQNLQATEEKKRLEERGVKQASTTSRRGPVNQYISYNSVTPSQYGETEVVGADKQPVVIDKGKVNLGNGLTKTLPKDDTFQFNTGTRMYFIGAIPSTVKQQLGIRNQDGSYTTEMPFETQNLTLLTDEVYATNMNSKFTTKGGSVGYRPKGHIMPIGTPGAVPIGRNYAIVELYEYLKTMPEKARNKIQMDKEAIKGVKVVLSTDDNQQVLSKFEGELEPVNVPKRNSSITVAKKRK
jgi:hypothetical protein